MPFFNNQELNADAFRSALEVQSLISGRDICQPADSARSEVKAALRRLYVASGGNRGKGGYDPSTAELRDIYNGLTNGAKVLALNSGKAPEKAPEKQPERKPEPTPEIVTEEPSDAEKLAKILAGAMGGQKVDPAAVKALAVEAVNGRIDEVVSGMETLIEAAVAKHSRKVTIKVAELPKVELDCTHEIFPILLAFAANRQNVMGVGPAGSGKTYMAEQVAKVLGLDYYFTGKISDPFQLTGFIDAAGNYHRTAFRDAYEKGGVFLFDEMDGSSPDAIIAFNAPLAGQWGDFPDGKVRRHPDFIALAMTNTYGTGADRQYVGREQLDGATLDRFAVLEIEYDEKLERSIATAQDLPLDWVDYVQKVRRAMMTERVRHIVSPRATFGGGTMLKAGLSRKQVETSFIWKGLEASEKNRVLAAMR